MSNLQSIDAKVLAAINQEKQRQLDNLELIASENIVSPRVKEVTASVMTNKYAEGYPNKRYYEGCQNVDITEQLAIDRAKQLFQAEHVNVQPHSGSQANMGVYFSVLKAGDCILGMDLANGGHLTHGSPVNFSGFIFKSCFYTVDNETHLIDYEQLLASAKEHKPKIIVAGASAYPRVIDFQKFRAVADEVGAYLLCDIAHIAGLVVTGHHPSSIPHSHFTTTTTHKTLRGPRGGMILSTEEMAKKVNSKIFPGIQGGPLCHIIAAKAVAFQEALHPSFKEYIKNVVDNAKTLAEGLTQRGWNLVSGGTDNHLILMDLSKTEITGHEASLALDSCYITTNKNTVPNEKRSPMVTSGVRLGTPALTSRGMKTEDMGQVADFIHQVLENINNETRLKEIAEKVKEFSNSFPDFKDPLA